MTTKEQIAEIVSIDNVHKTTLEERTQAILAIREIKEGQELWEKRDRLVELDEDQEWPASPYRHYRRLRPREFDFSAAVNEGYSRSKAMALGAGFRRVKVKG